MLMEMDECISQIQQWRIQNNKDYLNKLHAPSNDNFGSLSSLQSIPTVDDLMINHYHDANHRIQIIENEQRPESEDNHVQDKVIPDNVDINDYMLLKVGLYILLMLMLFSLEN